MKNNAARIYTGEVRFRNGRCGGLVLQVQIVDGLASKPIWVDAKVEDITRQKMTGAKP